MPKKYIKTEQRHIYSSPKLNFALSVIKSKTDMPSYRYIMESLAVPLSEILADKANNATFSVYPNGDTIIIQVFGKRGSIVQSGKNQPIPYGAN